ncbi:AAA family ATPase [Sphingomonas sp.]|uniref:ATP-binding protein n=1 Tax=Sphingomonas sp. TaxID=28214 RepID=UPI0031DCA1F2
MSEAGTITLPIARPVGDGDRIARAADLLRAHIAFEPQPAITPVDLDRLLGTAGAAPWSALDRLSRVFELDRFETALLLTLAAVSLDPALAATCAALQGQERSGAVSFALAGRLLPEARLAALRPDAPLRLWGLIVSAGPVEAASVTPFRIDERVLFHLAGAEIASEYLAPLRADGWLAPSQQACAEQIAALLDLDDPAGGPVIQLCAEDGGTLRMLAAAAGERLGLLVLSLAAATLPVARTELADLARACSRDLALSEAMLLLDASGAASDVAGTAAQFAALVEAPVLIATATPLAISRRPALRLDISPPTLAERRTHWRELAPRLAATEIDLLARTFLLDGADRVAAARLAGTGADRAALWRACRMQARDRLEGLAERIVSPVGWEDLVLPDAQHELLRDIVDHVAFAGRVFEDWGFDARLGRGAGVAALFAGASGTGKTLAAEVLANALERDLYRIDLSQVVSKYIGETEKNLSRIFAAAEGGGAILLFDEADALFGKRSEVQDSHDRYANIEVSYLLQRMETYAGLSILTTNLKDALDKAFLRRLRFIVQFAYPNAEQRGRIWERVFPPELPREGIDYARLAQYDLTGGAIRNVALAAAFLAARSGGPLTMAHCAAAAAREYRKLEKPLGARELGRGR